MTERFNVLIADRNPHVREFLRRELVGEGYRVQAAKQGSEVLMMTNADDGPDLLILDLDIPHKSGLAVLEDLRHSKPSLPVVVHTFLAEYADHPAVQKAAAFLEKTGNNIDGLKAVVADVLRKYYPQRFLSTPRTGEKGTEHGCGAE